MLSHTVNTDNFSHRYCCDSRKSFSTSINYSIKTQYRQSKSNFNALQQINFRLFIKTICFPLKTLFLFFCLFTFFHKKLLGMITCRQSDTNIPNRVISYIYIYPAHSDRYFNISYNIYRILWSREWIKIIKPIFLLTIFKPQERERLSSLLGKLVDKCDRKDQNENNKKKRLTLAQYEQMLRIQMIKIRCISTSQ